MRGSQARVQVAGAWAIVARAALLLLAYVHTLPARKHFAALLVEPSVDEAWKALGAMIAVVLYLLPPRIHARVLGALWTRRRGLLVAGGWLLAIAHAVPALDHLPRFFAEPTYGDAWRGLGSALASAWFVAPLPLQARAVAIVRRLVRPSASRSAAPLRAAMGHARS